MSPTFKISILHLYIGFLFSINGGYCQSSQLVDTTVIDGPVKAGSSLEVTWTGGADIDSYPIKYTLKQGNLGDLTTIAVLRKFLSGHKQARILI